MISYHIWGCSASGHHRSTARVTVIARLEYNEPSIIDTGQSEVKTGLFWRNLTAGGIQTNTMSVEMAASPLDFGPIQREIRLQERAWARGKFEMSETNPKSGEDLAE